MSSGKLLLKEGIVLKHDDEKHVETLHNTDVLVENGYITRISQNISVPEDVVVLDCKNKIVCPGLIDTHHHVWQTQLKGRHSDMNLLEYTPSGNMQCYNYSASDVFWGNLGGCIESIDEGTTTVVDHAHMTYSTDHVTAGLCGTITSGIRSIFCYSHIARFKVWNETQIEPEPEFLPEWMMSQLENLCKTQPYGDNGRVQIGFAFDAFTAPKETIKSTYDRVRASGVKLITSHWRRCNVAGSTSTVPSILNDYGLLDRDILLSHATGTSQEDFTRLKEAGAAVSSTPATEAQMGHGEVVGFREDVKGSLGADCHSNNSASILHAAGQGLAVVRSHRNQRLIESGKFPSKILPTTLQAFNLATIDGARAIGMSDCLGSLREGKLADIVIFCTDTPAMLVAARQDPITAVMRHAGTREVDTVIIGGVVRKRHGKLMGFDVNEPFQEWQAKDRSVEEAVIKGTLSWEDVSRELLRSRDDINARATHCNLDIATRKVKDMWETSEDIFV